MAGILDFLSGAPDLSSLQQLGVDPNQVAAYQQIQKQAQGAALGPALFGAVLNALSGPRRGAGTRALEGAGRAYESAEQRAIAEPLAMAKQSALMSSEAAKAKLAQQNADANTLRARTAELTARRNEPTGEDQFAQYRNDPRFKDVPFPTPDAAKLMPQSDVDSFTRALAMKQQNPEYSFGDFKPYKMPDGSYKYVGAMFNKKTGDVKYITSPYEAAVGSDEGPKPKLATVYGPGGATKVVEVGPGYTPPEGWSLSKPSQTKAEDEASKQVKISTVNDRWTKSAPYFEKYHPDYQKAHAQALKDAGATDDEAKALSGYKGKLKTSASDASAVDTVINKYLKPAD